jgi:hypothetical protein
MHKAIKKSFESIIALSSLIGLILIVVATILNKKPLLDLPFYFTIESNIFVFLLFLIKSFSKENNPISNNYWINGAVTLYISITGIVFFVLLRNIKYMEGIQFEIGNILLHYGAPISCILYWILFPISQKVKYRNVWLWIIYPLFYVLMILFRGVLIKIYPYPFTDVNTYGYAQVFLNTLVLMIFFVILGLFLMFISKLRNGEIVFSKRK